MRHILMILVDGYQDGMLSRMKMTSCGGGCKDLQSLNAFQLEVRAQPRRVKVLWYNISV